MAQAGACSITRRSLVAAAAAIPVAAASFPVVACEADPIFAAIAAHAKAYADVVALLAAQDAAAAELEAADAIARPALEARLDRLCDAEGPLGRVEVEATHRLVGTTPATLAGAAAALRYVRELYERDEYAPCEEDGYRALLACTERAIGNAAPMA
jgi:hypothetical protein